MTTELLQRVVVGLDLRATDDAEGTFEGLACAVGVEDSYGTTFAPGCWAAGGLDDGERAYALLHMHDPFQPVGTFAARETDAGLYIKGRFDDTAAGRDARTRAMSGSMPGLSVGFRPMMVDPDDYDLFTQVRLVEVSQITARMAAVPGSAFTAARTGGMDPVEERAARAALAPVRAADDMAAARAAARLRMAR